MFHPLDDPERQRAIARSFALPRKYERELSDTPLIGRVERIGLYESVCPHTLKNMVFAGGEFLTYRFTVRSTGTSPARSRHRIAIPFVSVAATHSSIPRCDRTRESVASL